MPAAARVEAFGYTPPLWPGQCTALKPRAGSRRGEWHGRLLRCGFQNRLRVGCVLRDRLPLSSRHSARRHRHDKRRGLQTQYPRHLQLAVPHQVRGGTAQARGQPGPWRHQRLRGPTAPHPIAPRCVRTRHRGPGEQPGRDRQGRLDPARHASERTQGERRQPDGSRRHSHQPGGHACGWHPVGAAGDPGLVLAAAPDARRHLRGARSAGPDARRARAQGWCLVRRAREQCAAEPRL